MLLRVFASALIAQHGAQKLFGALGGMDGAGHGVPFGTLLWLAGVIELVGGTLVLLGLYTRPVAFIISGEMAVAYFKVHIVRDFWPLVNRGEVVVLFCFVFLYFSATGAGAISLDYIRTRRHPRPVMR
ncbi:MAG TPA: DoxX family protein [Candidatus Elarobacter sp.]|nr:DoxX family protein [Candidatus Elarobacter sp.]